AADNLRLGRIVVADSVNPLTATRDAWRAVARALGVDTIDVEVICSDPVEHRRRVETRAPDIAGHRLPSWSEGVARHYDTWDSDRLVVATATAAVDECVDRVCDAVRARTPAAQRLLVITGSMGAGKTTVMAEAGDLLSARGVVHAAIDLDGLAIAHGSTLPPR